MMLNITQKKGSISSVILNEKEVERETGSWLLDLEKKSSLCNLSRTFSFALNILINKNKNSIYLLMK